MGNQKVCAIVLAAGQGKRMKSSVQKQRAKEIYDRYTDNGGNSYVHDDWDDCRKKGLL